MDKFKLIALIPTGFCFGLQNLTIGLISKIRPSFYVLFITTKWSDGEFERRLNLLDIPFQSTWIGMFSRNFSLRQLAHSIKCILGLPHAWATLIISIFRIRPQVVLLANHHEAILFLPILFFMRKKVVCHMHDPPPAISFQRATFRFWSRGIGQFICISENVRDRLIELGAEGENVTVIHNGIVVEKLDTVGRGTRFIKEFGWPDGVIIFGITGQLIRHKGHRLFLESAARTLRDGANARFVIGGRGNEAYISELKILINSLQLKDKIGFAGWLSNPQIFYDNIDVQVLASEHDEGFGLVIAEANERGKPCISTRSGGATEIVLDQQTGILVDKNDVGQMACAMTVLTFDHQKRQAYGVLARDRVSREFNLTTQSEKFADALRVFVKKSV